MAAIRFVKVILHGEIEWFPMLFVNIMYLGSNTYLQRIKLLLNETE